MNLKKIASLVVIVVIFVILINNIVGEWDVIKNYNWRFDFFSLTKVLIFATPIFLINALSWHLIAKALGVNISFYENTYIWLISNLSRYLPGGVWQYPARVYLFSSRGASLTQAASAVFLEALFNLLVGCLIVVAGLFFIKLNFYINPLLILILLIVLCLVIFIFFVNEKVQNIIFDLFYQLKLKTSGVSSWLNDYKNTALAVKLGRNHDRKIAELHKITEKKISKFTLNKNYILPIVFSYFLQYLFSGITLFFIVSLVLDTPPLMLANLIVIFTASWLVGYVTFFAPGGLGVQEASIAGLLSSTIPLSIASLVAILLRIVLYISELLTLIGIYLVIKQKQSLILTYVRIKRSLILVMKKLNI